MKRISILLIGAFLLGALLLITNGSNAQAGTEIVTEWFSERHTEYLSNSGCVEETRTIEHYVYERYLWYNGSTARATSKRLVPSNYKFNKYVSPNSYSGAGKGTKKYNIVRSKEYDQALKADSNGGYNAVTTDGKSFHAWSYYTVSYTQYRYRYQEEPITPAPITPYPPTPVPTTPEPITPEPVTPEPIFIEPDFTFASCLRNMYDYTYELENKNSGRMLNLYYGKTTDGSKLDTYPRDYTDTQRFTLLSSEKGIQIRFYKNFYEDDKKGNNIVRVIGVNCTNDTPKAGDAVCLYQLSNAKDSSYWKINLYGCDDKGFLITIESVKTPGLFIGHPDNDLKGTSREGLVLCTNDSEPRAQWYVYDKSKNTQLLSGWEYNRKAVVDYIRKSVENSAQWCVSLGSSALYVGGCPFKNAFAEPHSGETYYGYLSKPTNVGQFYEYVTSYGITEDLEEVHFANSTTISTEGIQAGDFLIVMKSTSQYHPMSLQHVAVVSEVKKKGNGYAIYFCQRNYARVDKQLVESWASSGWGSGAKTYVLKVKY